MLEDSVNKLTQLIAESATDRKEMTNALNNVADVLAMIKSQERDSEPVKTFEQLVNLGVVNDLPSYQAPQKVALPSKMELAKEWLKEHPQDMSLTGRELAELRYPYNVEISYVYWNKAKSAIANP